MWKAFALGHSVLFVTLVVGILCGCISVLVDCDHIVAHFIGASNGRMFHKPLLVGSCLVLCGCVAYLGRLYIELVLRGGK